MGRPTPLSVSLLLLLFLYGAGALPLTRTRTDQDCFVASGTWTFETLGPTSGARSAGAALHQPIALGAFRESTRDRWLDVAERIVGEKRGGLALPTVFGDVALCPGRLVGGGGAVVAVKRETHVEVSYVLRYSGSCTYVQLSVRAEEDGGPTSLRFFFPQSFCLRAAVSANQIVAFIRFLGLPVYEI